MIHLRGEGHCTIDELREARRSLISRGDSEGLSCFLVDLREMELDMSSVELYDFSCSHQDYFCDSQRMAVLYREQQVKREEVIFIEDISFDSGVSFKMFHEPAEARHWLSLTGC